MVFLSSDRRPPIRAALPSQAPSPRKDGYDDRYDRRSPGRDPPGDAYEAYPPLRHFVFSGCFRIVYDGF